MVFWLFLGSEERGGVGKREGYESEAFCWAALATTDPADVVLAAWQPERHIGARDGLTIPVA